LFHTS